jgi:hypothetical protein
MAPHAVRAQQVDPNANKPISLNFENAPIQNVLKAIFGSVGANYSVDPSVQGNVNIQMNNVGFDAALQSLLHSMNPPLTYDYDQPSNTYHVRPREEAAPVTTPTPVVATPAASDDTSSDEKTYYHIPIDRMDVAVLIRVLTDKNPVIVVPSVQPPANAGGARGGAGATGGAGMAGGMGGGMGGGANMGGGMSTMGGGMSVGGGTGMGY